MTYLEFCKLRREIVEECYRLLLSKPPARRERAFDPDFAQKKPETGVM